MSSTRIVDLVPGYTTIPERPPDVEQLVVSPLGSLTRLRACRIGAVLMNAQTAANASHGREWPLGFSFGIRYERGWLSAENQLNAGILEPRHRRCKE